MSEYNLYFVNMEIEIAVIAKNPNEAETTAKDNIREEDNDNFTCMVSDPVAADKICCNEDLDCYPYTPQCK